MIVGQGSILKPLGVLLDQTQAGDGNLDELARIDSLFLGSINEGMRLEVLYQLQLVLLRQG